MSRKLTKTELRLMRSTLEGYADSIQAVENAGKDEESYNSLWNSLDEAGAFINEILGENV